MTAYMDSRKGSEGQKEWDEALCPICMDHPHNAVLLICSSHNKGCRPYICDTSYRHSNCLDRFKKLNNLQCPLCRGNVLEMNVVEDGREYLNMKPRACSRESCSFSGNYRDLRRHARRAHPSARPGDIDPGRERAWRRLEDRREYDDIVSAIHTAVPNSFMVGDYMVEAGDRTREPRWLNTLVFYQMFGSFDSDDRRRSRGRRRRRRYLWGEDEEESDMDFNVPRRRRRLFGARSNDEDRR